MLNLKTEIFQKEIVHILIICIIGFLIYSNTFNAPFVFDDDGNIVYNPAIRSLQSVYDTSTVREPIPHAVQHLLKTRVIGYLTFAANYKFHALNVIGYHIINLIIHISTALLVYMFVLYTFRTPFFINCNRTKDDIGIKYSTLIPFFSALIFISHPIQTQAVTYIVQRFTSLATMLIMLSLVCYARFRLYPPLTVVRTVLYTTSITSAVIAMLTKEISFTLPIIVVLYELLFFNDILKKRILYIIPFLLTMLIIPYNLLTASDAAIDSGTLKKSISAMAEPTLTIPDYLFTQFRVLVTYIRLLLFPLNQNLDYDYPIYHSFFTHPIFLSFMVLFIFMILATALLYYSKEIKSEESSRFRLISFGIFWFFIALLPESSILPLADVIFEHRVYFPSIGLIIAGITLVFSIEKRLRKKALTGRKVIIPVLVVTAFTLSVATYVRNGVWQDGVRLYEDTVRKSPLKTRPHSSLGTFYKRQGRTADAERELLLAIQLDPNLYTPHYSLGLLYGEQGRIEEAIRELSIAVRLGTNSSPAHNNLGVAYVLQNRFKEAVREFQLAVNLDPNSSEAAKNYETYKNYTGVLSPQE